MLEIVSPSACVAQCVSAVAVCTRIFVLPQTFNFDSVIDEATLNARLSIYQLRSAATADIKRHDAPSVHHFDDCARHRGTDNLLSSGKYLLSKSFPPACEKKGKVRPQGCNA